MNVEGGDNIVFATFVSIGKEFEDVGFVGETERVFCSVSNNLEKELVSLTDVATLVSRKLEFFCSAMVLLEQFVRNDVA